jgi:hypothetical protein
MAQRGGQDSAGNVSAATRQLLVKLDQEDLHTLVRRSGAPLGARPVYARLRWVAGLRLGLGVRSPSERSNGRRRLPHARSARPPGAHPARPQVPDELVMYAFKQAGCNCDDDPQL